ncbi:MAG: TIGR02646 family protein [Methyloprofundus sp.]|nr:TIGR02646 family protein [Methyloprofundus sp.]
MGGFCSYCERRGFHAALAVEHIKDKDTYPEFKFSWGNFLLSCTNCNSIKSTKDIDGVLLPDRDNTYVVFIYLESGFIQVKPGLNGEKKRKAQALINLVGLDRVPNRRGIQVMILYG